MPEYATFISATETPMDGFMGRLQLLCGPSNIITSRVNSRAGMPLLTDHRPDLAIGMIEKLESKGTRVEGEAVLTETARNSEYLEELHSGLRKGISPGFLIHQAQAVDDPDDDDGIMLVITKWEPYEQSATPVPRNAAAGLLGITTRTASRASMDTQADIEKVVADAVQKKIASSEKVRDSWTTENAKLEERIVSQTPKAKAERAAASMNGKAAPTTSEPTQAEDYSAAFRAMLFGGPEPSGKAIRDFVGKLGQHSTIKLAYDTTTAHGAVTTMGGAMAGDAYFETSTQRILSLPRRIENLEADMQVPTLTQEPNSAMVAQRADRLVVVDASLEPAPPTLIPHRLTTVVDYSMETTLIAPGFEDFVIDVRQSWSGVKRGY